MPCCSLYVTSSSLRAVCAFGSQLTIRIPRYMSPFRYRSQNTCITDLERTSSIVNAVRSQSQEQPSFLSCSSIMPPCRCVHSQAWCRNSSRLRSFLAIPSEASLATTFASVAILAWSVPGTQQAFLPCIRALRTSTSCMVLLSMCPICSTPVTLGGGITIV